MGGQGAGVGATASSGHPSVWLLSLEAALGAIFVLGLETHVFGLLPLAFLPAAGSWSGVGGLAVLFGIGLLAFINTVLQPGTGTVANPGSSLTTVVIVFLITAWRQ